MNIQTHMSGQVPNQGTMSQQNGNSQMQNLVGVGGAAAASGGGAGLGPSRGPVDNDILKLRQAMRIRIFNILQQKLPSPIDDASKAKYMDVARRLEEGLFIVSNSKEDYMNQSTLEPRLACLIKGRQLNNYNQQRHANSSSAGTMIPTPGLQHSGGNPNMMVTSSVDATMAGSNNITNNGMENPSESIHSQTPEQFQLSQFQNQYQNNAEDRHAGSQILPVTSQSDMCTSVPQNSQQIQQMLHPQNMGSDLINSFSNLSVGVKSESGLRGQWQSQSQEHAQMSNSMSNERHI